MLKRKQSEIRFPLEQKLLLVVIPLIALSLMAVSVITYRVAKQNIQNRVSEYMEQYLLQLSSAIDNKLETSIQLNAQLSVNAQLSEILQEYHSAPSDEKLNYRQDVENIFVTIMSIYDNIRSITSLTITETSFTCETARASAWNCWSRRAGTRTRWRVRGRM